MHPEYPLVGPPPGVGDIYYTHMAARSSG